MNGLKNVLDRFLFVVTVALFALLVVVVVWQVFSRQVLGSPASWTDESARLSFVWLALFASAFVFGERGHIAMEFLVRRFSSRRQRSMAVGVQVLVLAFAVIVLIWGGFRAAANAWSLGLSILPFTVGQMYLALPVTGVLIAFYCLYYIRSLLTGAVQLYPENVEEEEFGPVPEVELKTEQKERGH